MHTNGERLIYWTIAIVVAVTILKVIWTLIRGGSIGDVFVSQNFLIYEAEPPYTE